MKTGSRLQCSNRSSGRKKEAGKTIENRTQPELVPNQASKSNIVRGALMFDTARVAHLPLGGNLQNVALMSTELVLLAATCTLLNRTVLNGLLSE